MKTKSHHTFFKNGLIDKKQFNHLNNISEKNIFSVFYELRTLLYLGILLFTSGVGLLIYTNLGDLGHYIALFVIIVLCVFCFKYVLEKEVPYSSQKVESPTPYYDYALLLGTLLLISIQAYLHFLYNIFEGYWSWNTLINSILLFYLAYRFDHIGLLSMAVTSLASFVGITVSPQDWINHELVELKSIYNTGIILSIFLAGTGITLDKRNIKQHFTFTYVNFSAIIFFFCVFTGLFEYESLKFLYFLLLAIGITGNIFYANWKKSFLFLIYAFLSAYVGITYLLFLVLDNVNSVGVIYLWAIYTIVSCIGFMSFVIKFKNYYKK